MNNLQQFLEEEIEPLLNVYSAFRYNDFHYPIKLSDEGVENYREKRMKACIKEVEQLVANKVLDEVKKEVEKLSVDEVIDENTVRTLPFLVKKSDISTLIEKLKVTPDTCSGSGGTKEKYLRP